MHGMPAVVRVRLGQWLGGNGGGLGSWHFWLLFVQPTSHAALVLVCSQALQPVADDQVPKLAPCVPLVGCMVGRVCANFG